MRKNIGIFLVVLVCAFAAVAQTTTGRLIGTVSGPDGVLPGAKVEVTDTQSGKTVTVVTDAQGGYVVPQMLPGTYTVKATSAGFKTSVVTDVVINVGAEYSLKQTLEVGDVSAVVTVTGGTDLVNTTNAEIGRTVDERQIKELPLNGRNPLSLILLQAGTSSNPSQGTAINGFRTSSSNILQDGINVQDNFIRSNATDFTPGRASVGNVAEFTITTQAGADRGFGGPQIELITPRGQNRFTGEAFIFNRNSKFAANNFFNNAAGNYTSASRDVQLGLRKNGEERAPRPFLNRNQYGGTLGGPILKNKLFFFGYYEALRLRTQVSKLTTTLTDSAKSGVFTYLDNGGVTRTINVFALGTGPTPIPTAINAAVQTRFLSKLPTGNTTEAGDGLNTTGYRFLQRSLTDRDQATARFDYQINGGNAVNVVLDYSKENNFRTDIDTTFNSIPLATQPAVNRRLSASWTTTPFANFTNQVRGGFLFSKPDFYGDDNRPSSFVVPTLVTNPEVTFLNQGRKTDTYNLQDTADWLVGSHSIRFGGQFQRIGIRAYNDAGNIPSYSIGTNANTPQTVAVGNALYVGGISPAQRNTGNSLFALLGGIVSSGSQTFNVTSPTSGFVPGATALRTFGMDTLALFAQDSWRVTPRLTLTYGLRYEIMGGLKSKNLLALEPVIASGRDVAEAVLDPNGSYQVVGGNAGKAGYFFKTDKNNFAPVINAAYTLGFKSGLGNLLFGDEGKSVFRGGFRWSYVNDEAVRSPDNALLNNQGFQFGGGAVNPLTNNTALNDRLGTTLTPTTVPTFVANRTYVLNNGPAFGNFGTVFGIDPNIQTPRVAEYNFGFQREIKKFAVEIRYVGSRSSNLWRSLDVNQIDIRNNGFLADYLRARGNLLACRATSGCTTGGNFNPAVTGSQALTVFTGLAGGGSLTNAANISFLDGGTPADMALNYVTLGQSGTVRFLPNPNTGVANTFDNGAFTRYNSLQTEIRGRLTNDLAMQANYTFGKTLTNAVGTAQTRVEPFLDNQNPALEVQRADFDQTHIFNFNMIWDTPFGKGKQFLNSGVVGKIFEGIQLTSIVRWASGAPILLTDSRGTLNRAGRSGRQTPLTNLSKRDLKQLFGIFKTPNGVYFINPAIVGRTAEGTINTAIGGTGRASNGFGVTPFAGQVFFNNLPGQTSGLERAFLNGPSTFQWDASILKNVKFGERFNVQIRAEAFNLANNINFVPAQSLDISSTTFGRISSTTAPRVLQFGARFLF